MKILILLMTTFGVTNYCVANSISLPSDRKEVISEIEYIKDAFAKLDLETVLQQDFNGHFLSEDATDSTGGEQVYWIRFSIENNSGLDGEWIFEFQNWAYVDFYYEEGGQYERKKTGHFLPFNQRDYPVANKSYINLMVRSGEQKQCFVRLKKNLSNQFLPGLDLYESPSGSESVGLDFTKNQGVLRFHIIRKSIVDQQHARSSRIIFAFLGIFIVMLLYNSFLFLATRLKSYGLYLLILFIAIVHVLYNSGYLVSILRGIESLPVWVVKIDSITSSLYGVAVLLFVQDFLRYKERNARMYKVINIIIIITIISAFGVFIHLEVGTAISGFTGLFVTFFIIYLCIKAVVDKYTSAVYFMIGYLAFLFSQIILLLSLGGIFPKTEFTIHYAQPFGATIEIIFFSYALANIINALRKENEKKQNQIIFQLRENQELQTKVNRELEQKVQERTKEINHQKEQIYQQKEALENEMKKSDKLLLNILPKSTAEELKEKGFATPKYYDNVSVLFTDFVGFTMIAEQLSPGKLVEELDFCFKAFDEISTKHHLEKIKTIGDAYMAAAGVPLEDGQNAQNAVKAALEMNEFMHALNKEKKNRGEAIWAIRIGINTGPVTAGVVGKKKFAFDIWGEAVNLAAIMESKAVVGKVNISEHTYRVVHQDFECTYRGKVEVKHHREIDMYWVDYK